MIKIRPAKNEVRKRDKKRKRLVLTIGKRKYHLTQSEGWALFSDLLAYLSDM